ncbi:uncharacterized protein BcabD6B2_51130 [Babesia caballi]|uniref:Uncharacterized protein n=1 Tax=Babesia caballi TaxID=5871 RepID=A0AAV4M0K6_BABCB|nr:hypothetical protein BcabD6B2_51130 [Babesia caballi]
MSCDCDGDRHDQNDETYHRSNGSISPFDAPLSWNDSPCFDGAAGQRSVPRDPCYTPYSDPYHELHPSHGPSKRLVQPNAPTDPQIPPTLEPEKPTSSPHPGAPAPEMHTSASPGAGGAPPS